MIAKACKDEAGGVEMLLGSLKNFQNSDGRKRIHVIGESLSESIAEMLDVFGERLRFPAEFVGRGDMSRGGLLLRKAAEGAELAYVPVSGAVRRGARPPKLPSLCRAR